MASEREHTQPLHVLCHHQRDHEAIEPCCDTSGLGTRESLLGAVEHGGADTYVRAQTCRVSVGLPSSVRRSTKHEGVILGFVQPAVYHSNIAVHPVN